MQDASVSCAVQKHNFYTNRCLRASSAKNKAAYRKVFSKQHMLIAMLIAIQGYLVQLSVKNVPCGQIGKRLIRYPFALKYIFHTATAFLIITLFSAAALFCIEA